MSEHSTLPPSSAARRMACPGSRLLEYLYPSEESKFTLEGDAAHWVAADFLRGNTLNIKEGMIAPNNEIITREMIEGAELYFNDVKKEIENCKTSSLCTLHIETKIDISNIHDDCWGTPDCWVWLDHCLYIWDYKFGHGFIEVFENWQLLEYAAGILKSIPRKKDINYQVIFRIVQPRSYHRDGQIREWKIAVKNLEPYFHRLYESEHAAMQRDAKCKPNPECTNCSGRHVCMALQRTSLNVIDMNDSNVPFELLPDQLGITLKMLQQAAERLDALKTGLEEQALALIKRGERVPYFAVETTMGRERWAKSIEEVLLMGELFGVNLAKAVEAITPKQAIKQGVSAEVVRTYSETPTGSLKLVAIDENKVRRIFKN